MGFRAHTLGVEAGGGPPHLNCGCENRNFTRSGDIPSQTQSWLVVSANGTDWAVLNALSDTRELSAQAPALREMQPLTLCATAGIHEMLRQYPIFTAYNASVAARRTATPDQPTEIAPGHMSMSGEEGSIAAFSDPDIGKKVVAQMNNTSSVLRPGAPERSQAEAAGRIGGQDGMEVTP